MSMSVCCIKWFATLNGKVPIGEIRIRTHARSLTVKTLRCESKERKKIRQAHFKIPIWISMAIFFSNIFYNWIPACVFSSGGLICSRAKLPCLRIPHRSCSSWRANMFRSNLGYSLWHTKIQCSFRYAIIHRKWSNIAFNSSVICSLGLSLNRCRSSCWTSNYNISFICLQ